MPEIRTLIDTLSHPSGQGRMVADAGVHGTSQAYQLLLAVISREKDRLLLFTGKKAAGHVSADNLAVLDIRRSFETCVALEMWHHARWVCASDAWHLTVSLLHVTCCF